MIYQQIRDSLHAGDEKIASDLIAYRCGNWNHEKQEMLWLFADDFNDPEILYDLILSVYVMDGYGFPKKLIQKAKRISKQIPEEKRLQDLPEGNPITVWRGAYKNASRTDISWTIDKNTAVWFANRYRLQGENGYVWEATIQRDKIIAYTNDRAESEIIQYMNVQNVHLLDISEEDWNQALLEYEEEKEKRNLEFLQS